VVATVPAANGGVAQAAHSTRATNQFNKALGVLLMGTLNNPEKISEVDSTACHRQSDFAGAHTHYPTDQS
jgi:hypothetical protein